MWLLQSISSLCNRIAWVHWTWTHRFTRITFPSSKQSASLCNFCGNQGQSLRRLFIAAPKKIKSLWSIHGGASQQVRSLFLFRWENEEDLVWVGRELKIMEHELSSKLHGQFQMRSRKPCATRRALKKTKYQSVGHKNGGSTIPSKVLCSSVAYAECGKKDVQKTHVISLKVAKHTIETLDIANAIEMARSIHNLQGGGSHCTNPRGCTLLSS